MKKKIQRRSYRALVLVALALTVWLDGYDRGGAPSMRLQQNGTLSLFSPLRSASPRYDLPFLANPVLEGTANYQ
jgi:hypothetical protein